MSSRSTAVGLFIAPIFPTGLPWLVETVPAIRGAMAVVVAASMLGGVLAPPALGMVLSATGPVALPTCLAVLAMLGLTVCVGLGQVGIREMP